MALASKLDETPVFEAVNYTKSSYAKLNSAIKAAEKVYLADQVTENQITSAVEKLDVAMKGLVAKGLNKSALIAAINEAQTKKAADYTWDSFANLNDVLAAANAVNAESEQQTQVDIQRLALTRATEALVSADAIDKSALAELLIVANDRKLAQEAWNALEVKVPEFSPWAPHGFNRLMRQLYYVQRIFDNADKNYNQADVNTAASSLNTAINTMRPGNLPEMEDLDQLYGRLRKARSLDPAANPELAEAIKYAEMVVDYVADGSGTLDMIHNASAKLNEFFPND